MGRRATTAPQRVVAVARGAGAMAFILQDTRDQLANIGFIVDNEDIGRHVCRPITVGLPPQPLDCGGWTSPAARR